MGKFRVYITEQFGLGNIGPNLDQFVNSKEITNRIKGAFHGPDLGGVETLAQRPMSQSLDVPVIERTGKITHIFVKKNPIYVRLDDGTECHFTFDEYKRIHGTPEVGKTLYVSFQRHPADSGPYASKIGMARVLD